MSWFAECHQATGATFRQPGFFFLLAEVYEAQGDVANATAQIQQFLKFSTVQHEKDSAKEYLAELESQPKSNEQSQSDGLKESDQSIEEDPSILPSLPPPTQQ